MKLSRVLGAIGFISITLTAIAQNREKRIKPVDPAQRQSFVKSSKAAVVVGIGDYPPETGLTRLQFARRDAEAVAAEFRSQGYAVRVLTDTQATRGIILAAMRDAADVVSADGTLLFYFSGHGFAPQPGRNVLATYGVTAADMAQDGLSVDDLRQRMQQSTSRRKVLLIDACRSEPGKSVGARSFSALSASSGTRMLLSTQMGRISYENDQFQQGVFTHFLLRALRGEAAGVDGLVTFRDVAEFVSAEVRQWSFERGQTQIPVELSDEASGDFLLAQPVAVAAAPNRSDSAPRPPLDEIEGSYNKLKSALERKDPDAVMALAVETLKLARDAENTAKPTNADEVEHWKQRIEYGKQVEGYAEYALGFIAQQRIVPAQVVQLVEALMAQNPKSKYLDDFCANAYLVALGRIDGTAKERQAAQLAGMERILKGRPDNTVALQALVEGGSAQYAEKLVAAMKAKTKPEGVSETDWEKQKNAAFATGYFTLGYVALQKQMWIDCDENMKAAVSFLANDQARLGTAYFGLGVCNFQLGKLTNDRAKMQAGEQFSEKAAAIRGPLQDQASQNVGAMKRALGGR